MRKPIFGVLAALMVMTAMVPAASADRPDNPGKPGEEQHQPVTICHRTNSNSNPYVQITVDDDAVDGKGGADHYGEHQGPVWNATLKDQHIKWGDIIPPVSPHHEGLNWTEEGRAIYDKDCVAGTPEEPPTTTTTEPPTTTTEPPTPPTTEPPVVEPPVEPPVVEPPVINPPKTVNRPPVVTPPAPLPPQVDALPVTGSSNTGWLVAAGIFLVGIGALLLRKIRV